MAAITAWWWVEVDCCEMVFGVVQKQRQERERCCRAVALTLVGVQVCLAGHIRLLPWAMAGKVGLEPIKHVKASEATADIVQMLESADGSEGIIHSQ